MPMLKSAGVIQCKIEATEGTDPGSIAAANAILVSDMNIVIEAEELEREIISPSLSPFGFVPGLRSATLTFTTELRGKGAALSAGAPLRDDPLWVACGFSPTYAANSATYNLVTSTVLVAGANVSCTIYAYVHQILHIVKGCRGNVEVMLEDGQFGKLNWTMKGYFDPALTPTTGGIQDVSGGGAATYDSLATAPVPAMGLVLQMGGVATHVVQSLTINMNNDIAQRADITAANGIKGFLITDRKPGGTFNPEAVLRGTHDFWLNWQNQTKASFSAIVNNLGTFNMVKIAGVSAQYHVPKWGDRTGIRTYDVDFELTRNLGDDEITVTFS